MHGRYSRSGIVACHEAARRLYLGISDVSRFAFAANEKPAQENLHVLYRIPWNYKSLAVGIGGISGQRDTMTMLWVSPNMCSPPRSAIAQPQLQDDRAFVRGEGKAKAASCCGAASKSSTLHRRLVRTGTPRAARRHLIHSGCWFKQKHAEDLSE